MPSITPRALYSARSVRADRPLMPGVRLVEQEGFQDRVRLALVEVVAGDLDHAGLVEKRSLTGAAGPAALGEPPSMF